jgi:hypothetical protein
VSLQRLVSVKVMSNERVDTRQLDYRSDLIFFGAESETDARPFYNSVVFDGGAGRRYITDFLE